jgi:lipoprotein signal peptidase
MSLRKAYPYFILLLVDQVSKIYIKTNLFRKKLKYSNGSKFFIENEGMAWGLKFQELTENYF